MRSFPSVFGLVVLASSAFATQQPSPDVFRKLEADSIIATKKKDIAWFENHYTSDFKSIDRKGTVVSRAQIMDEFKQVFGMMDFRRIDWKILNISIKGKTTDVKSWMSVVGDLHEQGRIVKMKQIETGTDTFVQTPTGWKMKQQKSLKVNVTFDGKPASD